MTNIICKIKEEPITVIQEQKNISVYNKISSFNCSIKEEKFNFFIRENEQPIFLTITGGGMIENFEELIAQYKIMLKTIYDTNENGIVDFAEAIKHGITVITALEIKNAIDNMHTHWNKSMLDSLHYDSDYKAFLIED